MIDNLHELGVNTDGDNVDNADVLGDGDTEWNSLVRAHRRLVTSIFLYLKGNSETILGFNSLCTFEDIYRENLVPRTSQGKGPGNEVVIWIIMNKYQLINNTDRLEHVNDDRNSREPC